MKQGFSETSVEMIANKVGISKAAIYYHYNSKDEILIKIIERTLNHALPYIESFKSLKNNVFNLDSKDIVDKYVDFFKKEHETFTIALVEVLKQKEDKNSLIFEIPKRFFGNETDTILSEEDYALLIISTITIIIFSTLSDKLKTELNVSVDKVDEIIKDKLYDTICSSFIKNI